MVVDIMDMDIEWEKKMNRFLHRATFVYVVRINDRQMMWYAFRPHMDRGEKVS